MTEPHALSDNERQTVRQEGDARNESPEEDRDAAFSRIAQAGRRVRAEAGRLLSQEAIAKKRPTGRKKQRIPKADISATLSSEERARLIEVTDFDDRPLLCMAPESALKHRLCCRLICLALRTRENRVILHKSRDARLGQRGLWDLYTDFVMVGEAREDAVFRLLKALNLEGVSPRYLAGAAAAPERRRQYSLFAAELPPGVYPGTAPFPEIPGKPLAESLFADAPAELLEVDADELAGLAAREPELFAPGLLWAADTGVLFRHVEKRPLH